jgi:hypothetical protein
VRRGARFWGGRAQRSPVRTRVARGVHVGHARGGEGGARARPRLPAAAERHPFPPLSVPPTFHGDLKGSFLSRLESTPPALSAIVKRGRGGQPEKKNRWSEEKSLPFPPLPPSSSPPHPACIPRGRRLQTNAQRESGTAARLALPPATEKPRRAHRSVFGSLRRSPPLPPAHTRLKHTKHTNHGPVAVAPGVPVRGRHGGAHPRARAGQRGQDHDPV